MNALSIVDHVRNVPSTVRVSPSKVELSKFEDVRSKNGKKQPFPHHRQ